MQGPCRHHSWTHRQPGGRSRTGTRILQVRKLTLKASVTTVTQTRPGSGLAQSAGTSSRPDVLGPARGRLRAGRCWYQGRSFYWGQSHPSVMLRGAGGSTSSSKQLPRVQRAAPGDTAHGAVSVPRAGSRRNCCIVAPVLWEPRTAAGTPHSLQTPAVKPARGRRALFQECRMCQRGKCHSSTLSDNHCLHIMSSGARGHRIGFTVVSGSCRVCPMPLRPER